MSGLRDTWLTFQQEYRCSIDRMLCRPALRSEFLEAARLATDSDDEESILWELMSLRKRKELSASHSTEESP